MEAGRHRQFVIHDCLGRGGFGEVYRATMVSPGGLKTKVALKLLRTDIDPGGDALSRLRDEGRLLAALRHPSILRAYDLAVLEGRIGLVTEFVDGVDLHRLVGVLEPRAALGVIDNVAEALDAAWNGRGHDHDEPMRLVHRDIKPSNIRISRHGEVKLLDFGIARSDEVDREARTGTGSTVGSLSYMAPERFSRLPPGPAADVYALGATLFEVVVGDRFHEDPVPIEMFRLAANPGAHAEHLETQLARLDEGARSLEPLLRGMLAHAPADRFTAAESALRCEALIDAASGPSLKRWAKDHDWPEGDRVPGSFDGRTITEGTLSQNEVIAEDGSSNTFAIDLDEPRQEPSTSAEEPPRRRAIIWPVVGVLLLVLGSAAAAFTFTGGPEVPAAATPPVVVRPDPVRPAPVRPAPVRPDHPPPVPAATVPATTVPIPAVPVPSPVPVTLPAPVAAPSPEAPPSPTAEVLPAGIAPAAPPPPPAPEPAMGRLVVSGGPPGVPVMLRSGAGEFRPGELPAGRYEVLLGASATGLHVEVSPDLTTHVTCNAGRYTCSLD